MIQGGSTLGRIDRNSRQSNCFLPEMRGELGFSVLRTWPISGSVFWFSHLKTAIFGFGVLCGLWVFSNLVFGFRFLSTILAVVQIFQSIACYGFSGFSKEVNSKTAYVAIYPDFLFEECMTGLVSLTAVIWVIMSAKQIMKS